jgi:rod shape-determining protein MreB
MLNQLLGLFSHDLAIDLGTANTLVFIRGKGIAIREPSCVARHKKTKKIIAIGEEAKKMVGKTPKTITAFRPLRHGVISDFDATFAMLKNYIQKVHYRPPGTLKSYLPNIPRPKVVVSIPSGVTEVERRAVWEACLESGARQAYLIEEPMAAAIGANLPVEEARGLMVVDIGGGTTEIAVISLGGIVINRSIRIAGDDMDEAIVSYVRLRHSLIIGESSAEQLKIAIGAAFLKEEENRYFVLRGRGFERGLPKSLKFSSQEALEALSPTVNKIVANINEVVEQIPPELVGDIMENGLILTGGGGQLKGLDKRISEAIRMPVWVAEDAQTCVVRGAAKLLDNTKLLERIKVTGGLQ